MPNRKSGFVSVSECTARGFLRLGIMSFIMTSRPTDVACDSLESSTVTAAVLDAVADRAGADVTDLPPLYDAVDPDALEALFDPTTAGSLGVTRLEFVYGGYEVALSATGAGVSVDVADAPSGRTGIGADA